VTAAKSIVLLGILATLLHCRHIGRLQKSFDEIRDLVSGRTAAEVEDLLGPPDSRQPILIGDERWIWWSYTYLDGNDYAPEVRGQVVHLEITFRNPSSPGQPRLPYSQWRIASPYGVSYSGLPARGAIPAKQLPSSRVYPDEVVERRPQR
jgi:hypothetical protein